MLVLVIMLAVVFISDQYICILLLPQVKVGAQGSSSNLLQVQVLLLFMFAFAYRLACDHQVWARLGSRHGLAVRLTCAESQHSAWNPRSFLSSSRATLHRT